MSSLYSCSKREIPDVRPSVVTATPTSDARPTDTTGTGTWNNFVRLVEAGKIVDPTGQYVSKSTRVTSDGRSARLTRPKANATTRKLASLFGSPGAAAKSGLPGNTTNNVAPYEGGGGGGYTPPVSNFVSTEMVQPYNTPPAVAAPQPTGLKGGATTHSTNAFYTTENPNGYVYDLKIVKAATVPFNDNPYYHNITIDLNEGAGGDYIYLSFTRDPSHVEYQRFNAQKCGTDGDEQPRSGAGPAAPYLDRPVTEVDTEVHCCVGYQFSSCFTSKDTNLDYFPMYATRRSAPIDSDYMTVQDLNDGAGGSYVYGYLTRTLIPGRTAVEVGVLTGNVDYIQPPAGWKRVGSDLNSAAGGKYIYFCTKARQ